MGTENHEKTDVSIRIAHYHVVMRNIIFYGKRIEQELALRELTGWLGGTTRTIFTR